MEKEQEMTVETPEVDTAPVEQPTVETPEVAAPEAKTKKTTKKKKEVIEDTSVTVEGVWIDVVGEAIHSNKGSSQYRVSVQIPRREDYQLYLRESILMKLREEDLLFAGVTTWNTDKIENVEVPVSFIGKNVFDLSRAECFAVKAYYGLGGFVCHDGDLRTVQKEIYRRFATFFNINNGGSDEYLKWQPIVLKRMICPEGDTVLPAELPVAIDNYGDSFRKTFRKAEK